MLLIDSLKTNSDQFITNSSDSYLLCLEVTLFLFKSEISFVSTSCLAKSKVILSDNDLQSNLNEDTG